MPAPAGYDVSYEFDATHPRCVIGVGFDTRNRTVRRFLVDLQFVPDGGRPTQIARFDHNETGDAGHDIRTEGLHIDIELIDETETVHLRHPPVPDELGVVIRGCKSYLDEYTETFIRIHSGDKDSSELPYWRPR